MKNWRYDLYLKTAQLKMDTLINRYHSEIQGSLPMQFYVPHLCCYENCSGIMAK